MAQTVLGALGGALSNTADVYYDQQQKKKQQALAERAMALRELMGQSDIGNTNWLQGFRERGHEWDKQRDVRDFGFGQEKWDWQKNTDTRDFGENKRRFDANFGLEENKFGYRKERDLVGDQQWGQQFGLNQGRALLPFLQGSMAVSNNKGYQIGQRQPDEADARMIRGIMAVLGGQAPAPVQLPTLGNPILGRERSGSGIGFQNRGPNSRRMSTPENRPKSTGFTVTPELEQWAQGFFDPARLKEWNELTNEQKIRYYRMKSDA